MGPDSLWSDCHPARRSDVRFWRAERPRPRPCCHRHPHRHGGHAFHRHQLRPHGPGVSQRGLGVHLCRAGNQSRGRLHHRLEHGDGLHAESAHLHDLVRAGGSSICSRRAGSYLENFLRRGLHSAQHSGDQNLGAHQRRHGRRDGRRRRGDFRRRGPLSLWPFA